MFTSKTHFSNKLLGLLCAVVLLIGSFYVPIIFSADAAEGAAVHASLSSVTFKDYPYSIFGRAVYTMSIKNSEKVGFDDDYALNFYYDGDADCTHNGTTFKYYERVNATDNFAKIADKVADKTLYKVSYMRKAAANCESNYKIQLATAQGTNIYAGYVSYPDTIVNGSADDTDWIKEEVYFTTAIKNSYNSLYILINSTDTTPNAFADVYIDNVVVEELSGDGFLLHYNKHTISNEVIKGTSGESVTLPTPTDSRTEFLGWFTDKELTVPFTSTTFSDGYTYLYAKWSDGPITFENYEFNIFGRAVYTMSIKKGEKLGFDDDYAVNFHYDGDADCTHNGTTFKHYERASSPDNFIKIAKKVLPNTVYRVTFVRKSGENCESDYKFMLATSYSTNIYGGQVLYNDTTVFARADDTEWVKEEIFFTPAPSAPGNDALFLLVNSTDTTKDAFVDAYIDHVKVDAITDDSVLVHANNTNIKDSLIKGKNGEPLELPVLTDTRCEFLGWYADELLTVPFTSTTFAEGVTHVYAKWSEPPITFETYDKGFSGRAKYTMSIKKGDGVGIDDDYALNFYYDADKTYVHNGTTYTYQERVSAIDNFAVLGEVTPNTVYKISYMRKTGKGTNSDYTIQIATGYAANIWAGEFKRYSNADVVATAKDTEWVKEEFYISTSFTNPTSNTLFILFNCNDLTDKALVNAFIDNVKVERVNPPYIYFESNNGEENYFLTGEAGSEIALPETPKYFGFKFKGWFTDKECTTPFEEKVFTNDMAITVYAGWEASTERTYTFEKYDIPHRGETSVNIRRDGHAIPFNKALSGNKVLAFDRTKELETLSSYAVIAYDKQPFLLDPDSNYVVNINYYVQKVPSSQFRIYLSTGLPNNFWATPVTFPGTTISVDAPTGKWLNVTLLVDGKSLTNPGANALFLNVVGGDSGIMYIDDVKITTVPDGMTAVVIDSQGSKDVPTCLIGKKGQSFAGKLPAAPKNGNKHFKGYYTLAADGTFTELLKENMKFGDKALMVYARFIDSVVVQDFDNEAFQRPITTMQAMATMDLDYRLYDSEASGNSKDNVTSGRYSLHRLGNTVHKENALVLNTARSISEGERYTVSFKVKMGKYSHTDGAVKIVSCKNMEYAWDTVGDYYPVVAIADLTDGTWHEVSYTFNSVEAFASIQTPGGVELFIDDVTFTLATDTPLSEPIVYNEYYSSQPDATTLDVSTIIDISLTKNAFPIWLIIAIGAAAIIVIGGIVFFVVKANKNKNNA